MDLSSLQKTLRQFAAEDPGLRRGLTRATHSEDTRAPVTITFVNASGSVLDLLWLDFEGAERSYGRIEVGERKDGTPWFAMEFLFGESLGDLLERERVEAGRPALGHRRVDLGHGLVVRVVEHLHLQPRPRPVQAAGGLDRPARDEALVTHRQLHRDHGQVGVGGGGGVVVGSTVAEGAVAGRRQPVGGGQRPP